MQVLNHMILRNVKRLKKIDEVKLKKLGLVERDLDSFNHDQLADIPEWVLKIQLGEFSQYTLGDIQKMLWGATLLNDFTIDSFPFTTVSTEFDPKHPIKLKLSEVLEVDFDEKFGKPTEAESEHSSSALEFGTN